MQYDIGALQQGIQASIWSNRQVGNYEIVRKIGEGTFSSVFLAVHTITRHEVVLKSAEKTQTNIAAEIANMSLMSHPHIVRLYEYIIMPDRVWLVLEYCGGQELFTYLMKVKVVSPVLAERLFAQLTGAVAYAHHLNCAHRDLKLENVLLDNDMNIKLGDFGFTRSYVPRTMLETVCGTESYMAPELVLRHRYNPEATDVWSLGVIFYAMLYGRLPFDEDSSVATLKHIVEVDPPFPPIPRAEHLVAIARRMLSKAPNQRPSAEQVLRELREPGKQQKQLLDQIINHPESSYIFSTKEERTVLKGMKALSIDLHTVAASIMYHKCDALHGLWFTALDRQRSIDKQLLDSASTSHRRRSRASFVRPSKSFSNGLAHGSGSFRQGRHDSSVVDSSMDNDSQSLWTQSRASSPTVGKLDNGIFENGKFERDKSPFMALQRAPSFRTPSLRTPSVQYPSVQYPSVNAPSVNAPSVNAPSVNAPSVNAPSVNAPSLNAPSATTPSMFAPSLKTPSVNAPSMISNNGSLSASPSHGGREWAPQGAKLTAFINRRSKSRPQRTVDKLLSAFRLKPRGRFRENLLDYYDSVREQNGSLPAAVSSVSVDDETGYNEKFGEDKQSPPVLDLGRNRHSVLSTSSSISLDTPIRRPTSRSSSVVLQDSLKPSQSVVLHVPSPSPRHEPLSSQASQTSRHSNSPPQTPSQRGAIERPLSTYSQLSQLSQSSVDASLIVADIQDSKANSQSGMHHPNLAKKFAGMAVPTSSTSTPGTPLPRPRARLMSIQQKIPQKIDEGDE